MVKSCAINGCLSCSRHDKDRHFYKFPSDENRRRQWIQASGRPELANKNPKTLRNAYFVCDLHFQDSDRLAKNLKMFAVPTLNLAFRENVNPSKSTQAEYVIPQTESASQTDLISLMRTAEFYMELNDEMDEDDLYLHFKKLMNSIVLDAAKINTTTLKMLHVKALEMTSILNNYDEVEDRFGESKVLRNKIVANEDEHSNLIHVKRKINESLRSDAKKIKITDDDVFRKIKLEKVIDELVNTYEIKTEIEGYSLSTPEQEIKQESIQSHSSFFNKIDTTFQSNHINEDINTVSKFLTKEVNISTDKFEPSISLKKEREDASVEEISGDDYPRSHAIPETNITSKTSNNLIAEPRIDRAIYAKATDKKNEVPKSRVSDYPDVKYKDEEREND